MGNSLGARDLRLVVEFLRKLYQFRDFDGYVSNLLQELPKLVPGDLLGYHEMNPAAGTSRNWWNPVGLSTPELDCAWERHMDEHAVLTHFLKTRDGRALKMSDFYSLAKFHSMGLHAEFYRPMHIEDVLCYALPFPPPLVIGIAIHRCNRDFRARDKAVLNILRPHLTQAWRIATSMTAAKFAGLLGIESAEASFAIVKDRRLVFLTDKARSHVATYFEVGRRRGGMPELLHDWVSNHWITRSLGEVQEVAPLVLQRQKNCLTAQLAWDDDSAIIVFKETAMGNGCPVQALTAREKEVASWLAQGKSNPEIAEILNISPRTVEKHFEHILQKTGTENRTAALIALGPKQS